MKNNFFYTIDVGNSDTVVALIKNYKILKINRYKTDFLKKKNFFNNLRLIKKILISQKNIKCIISSVVPQLNFYLKKKCFSILKKKPIFVSYKNIRKVIKINLKNKTEVGADRIVNTIAVKQIYKYPAIVIDFGTATTFDVINNKGDYEGGLIAPGINLSLQNLFKKTSKLPLVKLKKNSNIIGKNTKNAIQNGLYWGYVGLVTHIINKVQKKFKKKLYCISTGGLSKMIYKDIKLINTSNQNLTIYGLIEVYKINYCE